MTDLYRVRLISFGYGLLSLILMALAGVLVSPDFSALVKTHFGNSAVIGFLLLLVPELAKHLRNLATLKKLGAEGKQPLLI